MRRPSFQFYPGDWSSNPNLRRCTFSERGIWVDVMCLMHDQDEYGVLRWPLKEIAGAVGCKVSELQSLVRKGVMKGDDRRIDEPFVYVPRSGRKDGEPVTLVGTQDGPIWYSSRMVKDEYVRTIRGESGTNGATPKQPPKPPIGDAFGPRGSSSSSSPSDKNNPIASGIVIPEGATVAGVICARLRKDGVMDALPQHPKLLTLLENGLTADEIIAVGPEAVQKRKGFAWLLATAEGRRRDAAAVKALPKVNEKPWYITASGIEAKGAELGIEKGKDELFPVYKSRVLKAGEVTEDMIRKANIDFGARA